MFFGRLGTLTESVSGDGGGLTVGNSVCMDDTEGLIVVRKFG